MANARNSDPNTSHAAAADISRADRALVYFEFFRHRRLADFQLDNLLGGHMNGRWRKRRCDLTKDKVVVKTDARLINPATNKQQVVWMLVEKPTLPAGTAKQQAFASFTGDNR